MKKKIMQINVLGTNYNVFTDSNKTDVILSRNDGYIAPEKHIIVLEETNNHVHQKHVLIHEIVHAFLYESGLDVECWANNEEIVDWIAIQLFKITDITKDSVKKLKPFYSKTKKEKNEEDKK